VAVDAAQTALRLGAESAVVISLESRDELPAFPDAIASALSDGVQFDCSWGPVRILGAKGKVSEVEFQKCVEVVDKNGNFNPRFDVCELNIREADTVIVAIGQSRDVTWFDSAAIADEPLESVHPLTRQCGGENVFIAGDFHTGPSSVIAAMAEGREAAESADRFVMGEHLTFGRSYPGPVELVFEIDISGASSLDRQPVPQRPFSGKGDFGPVETGLDQDTARNEAARCYSCGQPFGKYRTCWFCLPCEVECPHQALYVDIPYLLR